MTVMAIAAHSALPSDTWWSPWDSLESFVCWHTAGVNNLTQLSSTQSPAVYQPTCVFHLWTCPALLPPGSTYPESSLSTMSPQGPGIRVGAPILQRIQVLYLANTDCQPTSGNLLRLWYSLFNLLYLFYNRQKGRQMIDLLHVAFRVHSAQFPHILDYFTNVIWKLILSFVY